jgi:hypothetical protein
MRAEKDLAPTISFPGGAVISFGKVHDDAPVSYGIPLRPIARWCRTAGQLTYNMSRAYDTYFEFSHAYEHGTCYTLTKFILIYKQDYIC